MMKKKSGIFTVLALFMLFAFIMPVLAEKTDGQWVPAALLKTGSLVYLDPGTYWLTDDMTLQLRDEIRIIEGDTLVIGSQEYNVYSYNLGKGAWDFETRVLTYHYDAKWSIPAQGSESGFSGNIKAKYYNWNPFTHTYSSAEYHCLLQGFGAFSDQTLMLSFEGPQGTDWTGYCLKG